jgi:5'-methylthioadenosine phosphorylase
MDKIRIGIIGGSGLYHIDGLENVSEIYPDTPFGKPSDSIITGLLEGVSVAFLPRHGIGHRISPSEIPVRANIYALKSIGVERLISISAVGSLREDIKPLDMVIPDQILDRTKMRINTFFEGGIVAHVGFAEPFCNELRGNLIGSAERIQTRAHSSGTYVVIEGPQFSTKAESLLYREWGCDVIGMTALPEAKLAREAEMCYAVLACATDYDCWRDGEETVTVDMVISNLLKNISVSRSIVSDLVSNITSDRYCKCGNALENTIITDKDRIPKGTIERLGMLVDKYI